MRRLTLALGMVALAAVLAACSGTSAAEPSAVPAGSPAAPGGDVSIIAKDIKFQQTDVVVKAGTPLAVVFDNQDGAAHDIKISDAAGKEVFKGEIVSNATVTYQVPALAAGLYTFICEVHPDMKGTIAAQ
jgi:plastocyanin